jgi:tetratricopeptide (TPR) repeat protein
MRYSLLAVLSLCVLSAGCNQEDVDPEDAKAYFDRGLVWQEKGEHDKAIADYTEYIRLRPKHPDTYSNRGAAWREKGEYDKANADFDEAFRLDPTLKKK